MKIHPHDQIVLDRVAEAGEHILSRAVAWSGINSGSRNDAGLDRLSFGGDASALTVAGGRYLTDNVYFEVIGGGEAGGAIQVEWQVRRNIAVTSRVGGDGDARLAIRWRNQTRQPGTGRRDRRPNRTE